MRTEKLWRTTVGVHQMDPGVNIKRLASWTPGHQWVTPIILATWEAEIGRTEMRWGEVASTSQKRDK
jgi:hypothetical protein